MLIKICLCFLYGFVFLHKTFALNAPPCFGYELFIHNLHNNTPHINNIATNQTVLGYPFQNILYTHFNALPANPCVIILSRNNSGNWVNAHQFAGGALHWRWACTLAVNRSQLGIVVDADFLDRARAALNRTQPPPMLGLLRGGYFHPMAYILFQLTNTPINFFANALDNQIVVHVKNPQRVSKNIKELSFNSCAGTPTYVTIRDIIKRRITRRNTQNPSSATIISYNQLQKS